METKKEQPKEIQKEEPLGTLFEPDAESQEVSQEEAGEEPGDPAVPDVGTVVGQSVPDIEGDPQIYGAATGLVCSEALLRLHPNPQVPTGLLALGSRNRGRFDPGQGTELLIFLARSLDHCIRTWLGLPPS